jgi:hypothetical protein
MDLGLRADAKYIRDLHAHPQQADQNSLNRYGALLTPHEMGAMAEGEALTSAMSVVRSYVKHHAATVFAGSYLEDLGRGGLAFVGFTQDSQRHLTRLRSVFPFPQKLRLFPVKHSLPYLDSVHRRIDGDLASLASQGLAIHTVSTSIQENRVTIGVASLDADTIAELENRYGRGNIRIFQETPITLATRASVYPPQQPGMEMRSPIVGGTVFCTANFGAWRLESGPLPGQQSKNYYQLTAGHCVEDGGSQWFSGSPSQVIGGPFGESYQDNTSFDGGIVRLDLDANRGACTYTTDDNHCTPVTSVQSRSNDTVGEVVCLSGIYSGYVCGTLRDRDVTVQVAGGPTLTHQRKWSDLPFGGDSGGPMFNGGTAKGVMSTKSQTNGFYSHIGYLTTYYSNFRVTKSSDL